MESEGIRTSASRGGLARAAKMSAEERSAAARKAVRARWGRRSEIRAAKDRGSSTKRARMTESLEALMAYVTVDEPSLAFYARGLGALREAIERLPPGTTGG